MSTPRRRAAANQLPTVQHIVQLMLENRSFDHMLGFLYPGKTGPNGQPFEGLLGTESNNGTDGKPVTVFQIDATSSDAYFMPGADPGEGYANTNSQLFGAGSAPTPPAATNGGFVTNFDAAIAYDQRSGRTVLAGTTAANIMGVFPPAALPVLSGLAKGFAVCDHWYSSVPTETFPNRAFACAGTSQGHMNDGTSSYTVQSIFGLMTAHKLSWKIYGYDAEPLTRANYPGHHERARDVLRQVPGLPGRRRGRDPARLLLPRAELGIDRQQPASRTMTSPSARSFIQQVYEALRSGPGWNQTLLIITYDEHGGCYRPRAAAVRRGAAGHQHRRVRIRLHPVRRPGTRGARVAADPGRHHLPGARPARTPIDHTSVLKTIEVRWGLPALTARDAAAPDLGGALTLTDTAHRRSDGGRGRAHLRAGRTRLPARCRISCSCTRSRSPTFRSRTTGCGRAPAGQSAHARRLRELHPGAREYLEDRSRRG